MGPICRHSSRRYKSCFCPIWVQGVLNGKPVPRSLDLTNWEAAQRAIRDLEIHGETEIVTIREAAKTFLADAEARCLKEPSIRKYKHVAEEFKRKCGSQALRSITVDDVRTLRQSWKLSGGSRRSGSNTSGAFPVLFGFRVDREKSGEGSEGAEDPGGADPPAHE